MLCRVPSPFSYHLQISQCYKCQKFPLLFQTISIIIFAHNLHLFRPQTAKMFLCPSSTGLLSAAAAGWCLLAPSFDSSESKTLNPAPLPSVFSDHAKIHPSPQFPLLQPWGSCDQVLSQPRPPLLASSLSNWLFHQPHCFNSSIEVHVIPVSSLSLAASCCPFLRNINQTFILIRI